MNSTDRYNRQQKLPQIGPAGQARLGKARILIIGLGGLGSSAAMQLASAGIGHIVLNDFDIVESHNLSRQLIHRADAIGELKTASAKATLNALNPDCQLRTIDHQLDQLELEKEIQQADAVLDCTDNYESRFLINQVCFATHTPLVFGAAIRLEGQTSTFLHEADAPCYACVYSDQQQADEDCAGAGVLGSLPAIIGEMQALQAIMLVTENTMKQNYKLLLFDASTLSWQEILLQKNPACPVCSDN